MTDPNAIAGGYTKTVRCARCQGERWVRVDVPEPYTCQRCRAVLAGRNALDPLSKPVSEARRAALREQLRTARGRRSIRKQPPGASA